MCTFRLLNAISIVKNIPQLRVAPEIIGKSPLCIDLWVNKDKPLHIYKLEFETFEQNVHPECWRVLRSEPVYSDHSNQDNHLCYQQHCPQSGYPPPYTHHTDRLKPKFHPEFAAEPQ